MASAIDLDSAAVTCTAKIVFPVFREAQNASVYTIPCRDAAETCLAIVGWQQGTIGVGGGDLLRHEDLQLERFAPQTASTLALLDGAALLDGNPESPMAIMGLFTPGESRVRWFWSLQSVTPLLGELGALGLIGEPKEITAVPHTILGSEVENWRATAYVFLSTSFEHATTFPHSAAYAASQKLEDLCPPIAFPATALQRIIHRDELYTREDNVRDLSDDRYIDELEPAERMLCSIVHMSCAAYLLYKRQYFKAVGKEVLREAERVQAEHNNRFTAHQAASGPAPADKNSAAYRRWARDVRRRIMQAGSRIGATRVRTTSAHDKQIQEDMGWIPARAKRLKIGWDLLGFLDEERVLGMVLDGYLSDDDDDSNDDDHEDEEDGDDGDHEQGSTEMVEEEEMDEELVEETMEEDDEDAEGEPDD